MVEAHDTSGAHLRTVHEIIQSPSGRGMLDAVSAPVPAPDSLYAAVLCEAVSPRISTTLADLVYAAILCRDFFGSAGIAEAVA